MALRNPVGEPVGDDEVEMVARVAAVDVAKATGMVCTRVPHPTIPGRRVTKVWEVEATTNSIMEVAGQLVEVGIDRVVIESTSDYWRPFVYLFEAAGLTTWLVNARDVKQVPGRPKTDRIDAVWLAKLNERGMLRASFVPPAEIRQLRDYTRLRSDLTAERTRHKQRMEKLLEDALIKLSTVATDIFGMSGRAMIEALIIGERDPAVLAGLAHVRMRPKQAALIEALTGRFDGHHAELARIILDQVDGLTAQIDRLTYRISQLIDALPGPPGHEPGPPGPATTIPADTDPAVGGPLEVIARLDEVPGIGARIAQVIVAEIGLDMSRFPTADHLVSWAKLSPQTIQSGAKTRNGATGHGNRYLKAVLGEAATGAAKTDTFLGARYKRLVRRRGKPKALVATARSILVIVWHLLNDPAARYHDHGADHYEKRINNDRKTRDLLRQLRALGHDITLNPAA